MPEVVDLFAGPGGWDVAARRLSLDPIGFELDAAACRTRRANGLTTVEGDLTAYDPRAFRFDGLIASPPCQGFSMAGKGQARADSERLLTALYNDVENLRTASDIEALIASARGWMTHEGTALVLEPLRWALAGLPTWCAWEQVPAVLPLWEACATILRQHGYSVAAGYVYSEQHGVPQTRKRAVLVARRDGQEARLPAPTHSRYHVRTPDRLDEGVLPWVSMAQALGMGMTERPGMTVTGGGTASGGAEPFGHGARDGMDREREAGRWAYKGGSQKRAAVRELDQPAPTIHSSQTTNQRWLAGAGATAEQTSGQVPREERQPAHTITGKGTAAWVYVNGTHEHAAERPGPTVMFGARGNGVKWENRSRDRSGRVTVAEAATLQSFPPDHVWEGTKTQVFQQIGNAVPPLMAEAILAEVLGAPFESSPVGLSKRLPGGVS